VEREGAALEKNPAAEKKKNDIPEKRGVSLLLLRALGFGKMNFSLPGKGMIAREGGIAKRKNLRHYFFPDVPFWGGRKKARGTASAQKEEGGEGYEKKSQEPSKGRGQKG